MAPVGTSTKGEAMDWYLTVWKKFADFNGRARRKEYWMFTLFNMVFAFVLGFIDGIVGTP